MSHAKKLLRLFLLLGLGAMVFGRSASAADHGKKLDEFLSQGKLSDAQEYFRDIVAMNSGDDEARTAQGLTEFLIAIEQLGQANYRHGLISQHAGNLPIARLPILTNAEPQKISYTRLREILADFQKRLATSESTLADVKSGSVQIPLYIGRVRIDLDGNGVLAEEETLWKIFADINPGVKREQGEGFYISVDGADVHWLRGYCNFLMAICDVALAYDEKELFEHCGQLLFPKIESPYLVAKDVVKPEDLYDPKMILDAIAAIHLAKFPLVDKGKVASAHAHLLVMIEQSRLCWAKANAEMDDDHEWIPNPDQTGVLEIRVSREMITGWTKVLDELEAILQWKKLIPYWRKYATGIFRDPEFPEKGTGINLKRVFLEPRDFDLVLTIQGSNVEPYLEEGPLSTPQAWEDMSRVFRGQFFGFAIWFN